MAKKKNMTVREWCLANVDRFNNRAAFIKACMKATGCGAGRVRMIIGEDVPKFHDPQRQARKSPKKEAESNMGTIIQPKKGSKDDVVDANEFLASVDVVKSVITFLDEEVGNNFIEDERLRRRFGLGREKWKEMKILPVFDGRSFTYSDKDNRRVTVWSSVKGIEKAKRTISMACYE